MNYTPINPVAIDLGFLQIHWYGLMYLLAFLTAYLLARIRMNRIGGLKSIEDLIFYGAMGVIIGGRVGYVMFYAFNEFLANPLMLFYLTQGGMSFHGGLLGVIFAMFLFSKKYHKKFFQVTDFIAPLVPLGLGFGRIGNFINNELWGKETTSSLGITVINSAGEVITRYPSQLYEALLEGLVLFIILWTFSKKPRFMGTTSALFIILYGVFRFLIEFVRVPDAHIGYLAFNWITMGQILSMPMILYGLFLLINSYQNKKISYA